jgi:hypothetical protein
VTELNAVLTAYHASIDCQGITSELLAKSRKGTMFHGTVFMNLQLDEARRQLNDAKLQLDDLTIVSLVSAFERIIFLNPASPVYSKPFRKGVTGLNDALKHFHSRVQKRVYDDAEQLCKYRDWVAHGKRWDKPASADPVSAHHQLIKFLSQSGLTPI